jgi:hypothetical protein
MKRAIALLLVSVSFFCLVLNNLYFNTLNLDMQRLDVYNKEINFILRDLDNKNELIEKNKEEYIQRLNNIKSGLNNTKTSIFLKKYKNYKKSTVVNIKKIVEEKSDEKDNKKKAYKEIHSLNQLSDLEIMNLENNNFLQGTYYLIKSYI